MNNQKLLIAFTGKKGSGKSTACDYFVKRSQDKAIARINFKEELIKEVIETYPDLVQELATYFDCSTKELFTTKPYLPFVRSLLMNHGALRRSENPDHWVDAWDKVFTTISNVADIVLVDDCRFLNEADRIHIRKGYVIRVINTQNQEPASDNISETEMDGIAADYTITASTIGELEAGVEMFLRSIHV